MIRKKRLGKLIVISGHERLDVLVVLSAGVVGVVRDGFVVSVVFVCCF